MGWLSRLRDLFTAIGFKSWMYQEGKSREVHVLETTARFLNTEYDPDLLKTRAEQIAYVRGYFDAEGGMPQSPDARFYIQFTQKDRVELEKVKAILEELGIRCGEIHNPSTEADPEYWRFYVLAKSHKAFAELVGSWHPRKEGILKQRMKI